MSYKIDEIELPKYNKKNYKDTSEGKSLYTKYQNLMTEYNALRPFSFSRNDDLIKATQNIQNYGDFSYDYNQDALYQQLKDQYVKMGNLAMQDTMGQAAAMTGGYANSYAQSVGQQAYQDYLGQLSEVVPELRQMALDEYLLGKEDLYNQYSLLMSEHDREYGAYQDKYNMLLDQLGLAKDDYYSGLEAYNIDRDTVNSILAKEYSDNLNYTTNDSEEDGTPQPYTAEYYEGWTKSDWFKYFQGIRLSEGKDAAEAELNKLTKFIPEEMLVNAAYGARGNNIGH